MIDFLIFGFGILVLSVLFHEAGHYFILWLYTKKIPKLSFDNFNIFVGTNEDYYGLKNKERVYIYFSGILSGITVIFFYIVSYNPFFVFLLPIYLAGCRKDINHIVRETRDE